MYCIHAPSVFKVSHCISARILQDTTLSEIIDTTTEEPQFRSDTSGRLPVISGIFYILWYHQCRLLDTILCATHTFTIPVTT
jgi:hypothetical protein